MTDEELIEQLRGEPTWGGLVALTKQAADRIEALIAERDEANKRGDAWRFRADIAEVKLAKAVEALEPFARAAETWEPDDGDSGLGARIEHPHHGLERHAEFTFGDLRRARATLAELKGETHDPL